MTAVEQFLTSLSLQQQHLLLLLFSLVSVHTSPELNDFAYLHTLLSSLPLLPCSQGIIPLLCLKGVYQLETRVEDNDNNDDKRMVDVVKSDGIEPNKDGYDECM